MIRPIEIKLIDRDADLNFYTKVTPVCVTIVDFNRNQRRRIYNVFTYDGKVTGYNVQKGAIKLNTQNTTTGATLQTITTNNKTLNQLCFQDIISGT